MIGYGKILLWLFNFLDSIVSIFLSNILSDTNFKLYILHSFYLYKQVFLNFLKINFVFSHTLKHLDPFEIYVLFAMKDVLINLRYHINQLFPFILQTLHLGTILNRRVSFSLLLVLIQQGLEVSLWLSKLENPLKVQHINIQLAFHGSRAKLFLSS